MTFKSHIGITLFMACFFYMGSTLACSTNAWIPGASGAVEANDPLHGVLRFDGECGLKVTGTGYVQDNSPIAEGQFIARFYFYPQFSGSGDTEIFVAYSNEATTKLFSVKFDGTNITVDASAASGGGSSSIAIIKNNWNLIEFSWKSGESGSLWVNADATKDPASAAFTSGTGSVEAIRLGAPSGFGGLSGQAFFDAYESHRSTPVGPLSNTESLTRDLVTHYYWEILGRAPDGGGLDYWTSEILRMDALGVDIKEGFIALGKVFFNSAEYLGQANSNTEYVTDLYWTFFVRAPDAGGLSYWVVQIDGGVSRNTVLNNFVFSSEFNTFMVGMFGSSDARPESNMVNDFTKEGLLGSFTAASEFQGRVDAVISAGCF